MQTPRELLETVAREATRRRRDLSLRELGIIVYRLYDDLAPYLVEAKLSTAERLIVLE